MDNFRHVVYATSGAAVQDDSQELNNSSPGLSGLNTSPKSGSISPYHEKEGPCGGTEEEGGAETVEEGEHPGGTRIIIPQLRNTVDVSRGRHRSSLSEAVLVNELSKPSTREEEGDAVGTTGKAPESPKWIDPEEKERLIQRFNVGPTRRNSRKQTDESSQAVTLARKLYMLDGFKKSEVAARLSQPTEFGHAVAREYLSFFDFAGLGLSDALRQFLAYFSLTGESQERERVMQHFSERYYECNSQEFPSVDAVHGLSIATLLLNTDLHTDHGGRKMSSIQFSDNLGHIGVELPRQILKEMYESIKKNPLQWAVDDPVSPSASGNVVEDEVEERVYHVTIPGTFVQAVLPGSAPVFKEGFVMKKNIMEAPHKKVSRGKRHWKAYYAYLKGFLLYFAPPQGQGELHLDDTSSAITVTHCLAMRAHDYHKKSSVVRVTTADWHVFLLQATDVTDMQQWIGAINSAAALYSSPPLAAPIGSQAGFHRPTFPLAPTRNSQEQQIESHEVKVKSLDKEAKGTPG
ncbi:PH and SEC7 domain-containing protein 3 [Geodia barretti]|nr:PH and SEC7 domain-containing protein 3 [Geodia barretti]